eukprot:126695_1
MLHHLVAGYIREYELSSQNTKVIPQEINMLCLQFYDSFKFMILVTESDIKLSASLFDYCNINNHIWNCHVSDLNKIDQTKSTNTTSLFTDGTYQVGSTAICLGSNISFPHYISNQLIKSNINEPYTAIFHCGGQDNINYEASCYCNVAVLSQRSLSMNNDSVNVYNCKLPSYPIPVEQNQIVFCHNHNYYGLYSIDYDSIYYLSFKNNAQQEWVKLNLKERKRLRSQIVFIDDYKKLMIISGDDMNGIWSTSRSSNDVEMIEFENNNKSIMVSSINQGRIEAGVTFDKYRNCVYVVGGYDFDTIGSLNKSEYYDINKNKWYNLPDTHKHHDYYPMVWIEDNLLYVTSTNNTIIECIDLRVNRSWIKFRSGQMGNIFGSFNSIDCKFLQL